MAIYLDDRVTLGGALGPIWDSSEDEDGAIKRSEEPKRLLSSMRYLFVKERHASGGGSREIRSQMSAELTKKRTGRGKEDTKKGRRHNTGAN